MTSDRHDLWVVYSPNESATSDGAGFWSNTHGWTSLCQATRFSTDDTRNLAPPVSFGGDASFVSWREAWQSGG